MDKFMYLFDFEFKRNLKYYIGLVITMCTILTINLILNLKIYNKAIKEELDNQSIEEIYNKVGGFNFENLITEIATLIFIVGISLCLIYSFVIWARDFNGKSKSIYTLLTLPSDRMKIYFSKLLNILCLIYMYIISFVVTLFINYKILPNYMLGKVSKMGFVQDTSYALGRLLPYNFIDFIGVYVFLIIAIICTIFIFILIGKCSNKPDRIITKLILIPIGLFTLMVILGILLSGNTEISIIIYSIGYIAICISTSKILLNNKIDW